MRLVNFEALSSSLPSQLGIQSLIVSHGLDNTAHTQREGQNNNVPISFPTTTRWPT